MRQFMPLYRAHTLAIPKFPIIPKSGLFNEHVYFVARRSRTTHAIGSSSIIYQSSGVCGGISGFLEIADG